MDLVIRTATRNDIASVLSLWRVADAVSATDDPASIQRLIERDPRALTVAQADGRLVGTLIAGWDGWRAGLYRLAVDPGWRRRGVARALVEHAESRLLELGARRIAAIVVSDHEHATAFWRSVGYEHDERVDRYVKAIVSAAR